jgi:hypothetical protein
MHGLCVVVVVRNTDSCDRSDACGAVCAGAGSGADAAAGAMMFGSKGIRAGVQESVM